METSVSVPLNTMLADLDETLRVLLKRELGRQGFKGVEIAFDAPTREWSATLSSPTVNLFLYDLRESLELRPVEWEAERENGRTRELRPPLRLDASYALTAWTRAVEDEHRLLSQVLAVMYAFPTLPDDVLASPLAEEAAQRYPLRTRVAQARSDGAADFWSAVGGQYKASVDFVVTASCEAGTVLERGADVRSQTVRTRRRDGGRSSVEETHSVGGTVRDSAGKPVANAWVAAPNTGHFATTDEHGRFQFNGLPAGRHKCVARASDGGEAEGLLELPGGLLDLTIGRRSKRAAKRSR